MGLSDICIYIYIHIHIHIIYTHAYKTIHDYLCIAFTHFSDERYFMRARKAHAWSPVVFLFLFKRTPLPLVAVLPLEARPLHLATIISRMGWLKMGWIGLTNSAAGCV